MGFVNLWFSVVLEIELQKVLVFKDLLGFENLTDLFYLNQVSVNILVSST
jgi:hypothetical protein